MENLLLVMLFIVFFVWPIIGVYTFPFKKKIFGKWIYFYALCPILNMMTMGILLGAIVHFLFTKKYNYFIRP